MAQLLTLIERVIAQIGTVLTILGVIQGSTSKAAQENVPFHIDNTVDIAESQLSDATFGLAAIKTAIDTLTSNQATEFADIMAAIAAVQQAGSPVTLPTTPPSGYGSFSPTDTAAAVWEYVEPNFTRRVGDELATIFGVASRFADWGIAFPSQVIEPWWLCGDWSDTNSPSPASSIPFPLDFTTIIESDKTVGDWYGRVWESAFPTFPTSDGTVVVLDTTSSFIYWLNISQAEWDALRAQVLATVAVPPVWPGLSGATLLTPVAIDVGVTITETMQGALISITSAPVKSGFFTFDDALSYRNIGALAFFTDNGDLEFPQLLGFTTAVYLPKTMETAAGLKLRSIGGVTGTITPFTIP
jgi:hypothetical protein